MDSFPPYQSGHSTKENSFKNLSHTIGTNIRKISQNVSSMQKMVNLLGTAQDTFELRNQQRQVQTYTQQLVKDTAVLLKQLMGIPLLSSEQSQNKLICNRLSEEYIAALNAFQTSQKLAAEKTKDDVRKTKEQNTTINIGDPFALGSSRDDHLIEMDNTAIHKQQQLQMTERELQELEQNESDIRQLESNILDVNHIFKELGTMIHEQGTLVDSIESNIESTTTNVQAGTEQLRQASSFKNKLRKKKLYLAIILVVVIVIILIIIFHN